MSFMLFDNWPQSFTLLGSFNDKPREAVPCRWFCPSVYWPGCQRWWPLGPHYLHPHGGPEHCSMCSTVHQQTLKCQWESNWKTYRDVQAEKVYRKGRTDVTETDFVLLGFGSSDESASRRIKYHITDFTTPTKICAHVKKLQKYDYLYSCLRLNNNFQNLSTCIFRIWFKQM